jgi:tRNA A37 threonylcarbamoyladenosine synthetase subunit TsaC/SUA5/YrdC
MLLLLPTDTCYGLAGEFTETDYLEIYRLKDRDFTKLLAILVEDFSDMNKYIEISDEQIEFLQNYPHPWSFLGKKKSEFILPEWMDSEKYQMLSIRVASVCLRNTPPEKGE